MRRGFHGQIAPGTQAPMQPVLGGLGSKYALDERTQIVTLTERGVERVEQTLPELGAEESMYDPKHTHMLPYLDNAL